MSENELRAQRRVTEAFIAANPSVLVLTPRERVKDANGARLAPGTPRNPQTLRLIDQSSSSGATPGRVETADGVQREIVFVLLGPHDAQIGLHDSWADASGTRYEVVELLPFNGYERRAQVVRYGP